MIVVGILLMYVGVGKEFEGMLVIGMGLGMLIGKIGLNMEGGLKVGVYEEGWVLKIL